MSDVGPYEMDLHFASKYARLNSVKALTSKEECDLNILDERGNTPLHTACKHGHYFIVEFLVADQRCQLNNQNRQGETPLYLASKNDHRKIIKVLGSRKECDFNIPDEHGNTPLHIACMYGHDSMVQLLVADRRCQLNTWNRRGETPLHIASEHGDINTIKALIGREECDLNILDERGNTPLHAACKRGHHSTVQFLVADQRCQLNAKNRDGETPVHLTFERGDIDTVKVLIGREERDLNIPDEGGNTPLHTACKRGHHSTVQLPVADQRYQLNAKNRDGETPVHLASEHGDIDTLIGWEESYLHIPDEGGNTPLHTACKRGHHSTAQFLVADQRYQLNAKNRDGETLVHLASGHGDIDTVRVLIGREECDLNIPDEGGNTPLHTACKRGHHSTVQLLVADQRCQLNAKNRDGETPVHLASEHGDIDTVKVLIGREECDLNIPDEGGNTPLHTACKHGHHSTVQSLVADQRCQINTTNGEMNTPLLIACHAKALMIIGLLLDRKCSINIPNKKGETAEEIPLNEDGDCLLHIACQWGDVGIVSYLITDQRCNPNITNASSNTPLHTASEVSNLDVVKVLVGRKECDLNIPDEGGNTPLHTACKHGHHSTVQFLVADQRCQLNAKNRDSETPVYLASEHGDINTVKVLIGREECDLNIPDEGGNTPLHTACKRGHHSTVQLLVADQRYQVNAKNRDGETLVHLASEHGDIDTVKVLIGREECDLNIPDEGGNTPLHAACKRGHHSTVQFLVTDQRCQLNAKNRDGETPVHLASKNGNIDTVKVLIGREECDLNIPDEGGNTPLHAACKHGHHSTVQFLVTDQRCQLNAKNRDGETPVHLASKNGDIDTVKVLIGRGECDLNIPDERGNTPLHLACQRKTLNIVKLLLERKCRINIPNKKGKTAEEIPLTEDGDCLLQIVCLGLWDDMDMIKYLVTDQKCDPNILNKYHLTPLLAAIRHGEASVATTLLQHAKCDLSLCDRAGNTALHLACLSGQTHTGMVKVAKSLIISGDPLCVNSAGQTPIELTTNYELIQAISHFTRCKTKHSVQTYINLFIVGNPGTGKSTLVKAICKEASILQKILPKKLRRVKNVPPHTAGIIPTTFQSKIFGNTVLHDLAGQIEYYTSHAAVIQTTVISTPPAFIIVVNMSDSEEKISETLRYWWSFINNHAARASAPPQVILVGSYADKVKASGGSVQEKMSQMSVLLQCLPTSFCFAGQVALDCRDPASKKLRHFCSLVNDSCVELRKTADVDLCCHVLYAFLLEKFSGKVACTISDIVNSIQESDALLPQNPDDLIPLISTLSDKGLLLLVEDSDLCGNSWVILQKQALLGEINGTIFAPKDFSQHMKDLSSSTGVVPLLKLKSEFPHYNPAMIAKFLVHLEFCFKVDDHETLELLKDEIAHDENVPRSLSEEYYFFPALVSVENPLQVWEQEQDADMVCQSGWFYRCIRNDQFLTTHFLHVLILRLAFFFALRLDPGDCHEGLLALHRRCSVWKHGIGWFNGVPIETVVEVGLLKQSVIVMMRCPKGEEAKCAQLRSKVIQKVLEAKDEHCKAVEMCESFIHPTHIKYPFFHGAEDLKHYSLSEIARATVREAANVLDCRGRNPLPVKDLLLFDPSGDTSRELLSELFSKKHSLDEQVREQVLEKLLEAPLQPAVTPERAQVGETANEVTQGDDFWHPSSTPTLHELLNFPGQEKINIPQEIGTKYKTFGIILLEDDSGARVDNIVHEYRERAERINTEILQEWLTGRGKQPVTWETLVKVLQDIKLSTLAGDISSSKCPS